jgi:hypothetical protein
MNIVCQTLLVEKPQPMTKKKRTSLNISFSLNRHIEFQGRTSLFLDCDGAYHKIFTTIKIGKIVRVLVTYKAVVVKIAFIAVIILTDGT